MCYSRESIIGRGSFYSFVVFMRLMIKLGFNLSHTYFQWQYYLSTVYYDEIIKSIMFFFLIAPFTV